jgi:hypothetical protein
VTGVAFEDLIDPRAGIEGFGPAETSVLVLFRADLAAPDQPELAAIVELPAARNGCRRG